jgi:hypothetical protein
MYQTISGLLIGLYSDEKTGDLLSGRRNGLMPGCR